MSTRRSNGRAALDRVGHTLADKVEAALRDEIIRGARLPGERLNEVEIAFQLGVSRGPVREALQRLSRDGLLRMESHRGAFVRELDVAEVRELFEVRASLERQAASLAAERAGADEIDALRGLLDRARDAVSAPVDPHYPERLDVHELIVGCARNEALVRYLALVNQELKLVRARSGFQTVRAPKAFEEHARVVEAIAARDPHAAAEAMNIHMESALQSTLGLLREPGGTE